MWTDYQKYRFLGKSRGPVLRRLFSSVAWFLAFALSGSRRLSAATARHFNADDFTLGVRRIAWLARRGRLTRFLKNGDQAFDISADLKADDLRDVEAFLDRHQAKHPDRINHSDRLFLAAGRCALSKTNRRDFIAAANKLLAHVPEIETVELVEIRFEQAMIPKEDAELALRDFDRMLRGVPWFVISGTFLGIVREGGFLSHDYDIDVGVNGSVPLSDLLDCIAAQECFALRKVDIQPAYGPLLAARPMLLKLIHCTGVPIDIFYHYRTEDDRVVHGSSLHHWFNSPFALSDYTLSGISVRGPDEADRYLTENYGDWRTPVTDFNCSTDTPNLAIVRHPISISMFLRRLAHFAELGHPNLPRLKAELLQEGIIVQDEHGLALSPGVLD